MQWLFTALQNLLSFDWLSAYIPKWLFDPSSFIYVFAFQEILIAFALFIVMWFSIFAIITSILVIILLFVSIYHRLI